VDVVSSLSQGLTAAAQCGLLTYKSVPVIFEPPCISPSSISVVKQVLLAYVLHSSVLSYLA